MSKEQKSTIILMTTALIWGVGFVAQTAAMNYMDAFTFNAVRFILGGLALTPVFLSMEKGLTRSTIKAGLAGGSIVFIAASLQQFGIAFTGVAGKAGFITGLYIVLVPILGMFVGRKTTRFVWAGAVMATIGLYFISAPQGLAEMDIGSILLIVGAFCWALHILVVDRFVNDIKPLGFSAVQCLTCGVLSLFAAFIFDDIQVANIVAGYIPVIYAGLISACIAYTLQIIGQKHVPPGKSAIILSIETVVAAVAEAIILGVFLTSQEYFGGGLIFAGIIISQFRAHRSKIPS